MGHQIAKGAERNAETFPDQKSQRRRNRIAVKEVTVRARSLSVEK